MRVLVSDYREQMEADYSPTIAAIKEVLSDAVVVVEPYDTENFYRELKVADGWITAFVPVNQILLDHAKQLKCISLSAVGYSNVCLSDLEKRNIALCHIEEYCTREVAEHAVSLMMALNRNFPQYESSIRDKNEWNYQNAPAQQTLNHKRLCIFGFGRIGKTTAALAGGLQMEVAAVDPFVSKEAMAELGVKKLEKEEALDTADILINHMSLTGDNRHYFDRDAFAAMKKQPIFINVGRGGCVDEEALLQALDSGQIYAAGLDVLESEQPDLKHCSFVGRADVILTPHSAFYSSNSIERLHTISGHNLAYALGKAYDSVEGLLRRPEDV